MKREFDDFIVFAANGLSSARMVIKYLGVEFFPDWSCNARVGAATSPHSATDAVTVPAGLAVGRCRVVQSAGMAQ